MNKLLNHIEQLKLNCIDNSLKKELSKINLLTEDKSNAKLSKNSAYSDYKTFIMYLSPASLSGVNVCPWSSQGCRDACLNSAGRGRFSNVQNARLRKTLYMLKLRLEFFKHLNKEITRLKMKHPKLAIRLNGTSDLNFISVIKQHPEVQFYDYTKSALKVLSNNTPNYHLTYSYKGPQSKVDINSIIDSGNNIAIVFDQIPNHYMGYTVINGDSHDMRFLDDKGVIVGLTAKGDAKKDYKSGFVVRDALPTGFKIAS